MHGLGGNAGEGQENFIWEPVIQQRIQRFLADADFPADPVRLPFKIVDNQPLLLGYGPALQSRYLNDHRNPLQKLAA